MSSEIIINDLSEIITKLKNELDSKQLTIERLEKELKEVSESNDLRGSLIDAV